MSNATKSLIMIVGCLVLPLLVMLGSTFVPESFVEQNQTLFGVGVTLATILAGLIGFVITWGYIKNR